MSHPELVVAVVLAHGWRVTLTAGGPVLVAAVRGAAPLPPDLLKTLKNGREEIIAHLARNQCRPCGRVVDAEDRDCLAGVNALCDEAKCPYRKRG